MATDFRVNLYQRSTVDGAPAIVPVGGTGGNGGWDGQRKMRGIAENITVIYALGLSSNDNETFEVKMNGARSFITDWDGLSSFNFVRVNKYAKTLQPEGSDFEGTYKYQYFGISAGSSARVVAANVATCISIQVNGVDVNGEDQGQECFKITMIGGETFVTDHDGWSAIQDAITAP
jgi:hypothetical protein